MQAMMERTGHRSDPQPRPRDALDLLEQFGTTVALRHDQEIHGEGGRAEFCYRIIAGCVRTVKLMEDGRRQIGEFLMAGDLLGFNVLDSYDFSAEAVTDVVLRRYPRRMVDALAGTNLRLAQQLREMASVNLRAAYTRLLLLGRKTAAERIASFLLELSRRLPHARPHVLELPMGRVDIADHLGLTIETVCRLLGQLRRAGTIAIDRGSITVRDLSALQDIASESQVAGQR